MLSPRAGCKRTMSIVNRVGPIYATHATQKKAPFALVKSFPQAVNHASAFAEHQTSTMMSL